MPARRITILMASIAIAASAVGAGASAATAADAYRYPSDECPKDGDHGLQDCIDDAASGDTIVLVDEIIDERALIRKSLTLKGVDRTLHPQLTSISVSDTPTQGPDVVLQDLIATFGIDAYFDDHPSSLVIRRVRAGTGQGNVRGIEVGARVPVDVTVRQSYVRTTMRQTPSLHLYSSHTSGTARFRAVGNTITQHGGDESGSGIGVALSLGGTTEVDIHNNSIWDVVGDPAGGASGILVYVTGPSRADIDVVGNTVDRVGADGLLVRAEVTAGGRVVADVFGNVFSHTADGAAMAVSGADRDTLTFRAGYNAFFRNDRGRLQSEVPFSMGPGNVTGDPRYVDRAAGDLRLRASSPVIDRGRACTAGGLEPIDAAGNFRWAGRDVDMGAFERGAGAPSGAVVLGGSGRNTLKGTNRRDVLCGFGGNDTLRSGGGPDYLDGGPGNDTLCARDGVKGNDSANGGSGTDRGRLDTRDRRASVERIGGC